MNHLWDSMNIVKHAVYPESHKRLIPFRLYVDIAGPLVKGIFQEVLHRVYNMLVTCVYLCVSFEFYILLKVAYVNRLRHALLRSKNRCAEAVKLPDNLLYIAL